MDDTKKLSHSTIMLDIPVGNLNVSDRALNIIKRTVFNLAPYEEIPKIHRVTIKTTQPEPKKGTVEYEVYQRMVAFYKKFILTAINSNM